MQVIRAGEVHERDIAGGGNEDQVCGMKSPAQSERISEDLQNLTDFSISSDKKRLRLSSVPEDGGASPVECDQRNGLSSSTYHENSTELDEDGNSEHQKSGQSNEGDAEDRIRGNENLEDAESTINYSSSSESPNVAFFEDIKKNGMPNCLKWLEWKVKNGVSERAMTSAMQLFDKVVSPYHMKEELRKSGLYLRKLDACVRGHIAFSRSLNLLLSCPVKGCEESRFKSNGGSSRESFEFLLLEDFVEAWMQSEHFCNLMKYRHRETMKRRKVWKNPSSVVEGEQEGWFCDYLDGSLYRELDEELVFQEYDICFQLTFDGYQLFKNSFHEAWPFVLLNLNLPPSARFKIENMIPYGITPGPSSPSDLISYLDPLIERFERFSVPQRFKTWNGQVIKLRLFLILVTADTPAINKILHARGHNARSPCRLCTIKGILSLQNHYYYPSAVYDTEKGKKKRILFKPERIFEKRRDFKCLLNALSELKNYQTEKEREEISQNLGFKRVPEIILRLPSLKAFSCFPIDIMHILYMNIPKYMWKLWSGSLDVRYSKDDFVLESPQVVGKDMERCGRHFPVCFGRRPRNIAELAGSLKAEEWKSFILHFSIPLLEERLPMVYLKGWKLYVEICSTVSRSVLHRQQVETLNRRVMHFYKHYEEKYFRCDLQRLPLMKYVFHSLLHLPECMESWGPLCNVDQFKAERFMGYLRTQLHSKFRPVRNLMRNLVVTESLKLIRNVAEGSSVSTHESFKTIGFTLDRSRYPQYESYELLSPSGRAELDRNQLQLLRTFLMKEGCSEDLIRALGRKCSCRVYGRLRIHTGEVKEIIGAREYLQRRGESARWNCFVRTRFEYDGRASSWYGVVERYSHIKLDEDHSFLVAWIRWAEKTYRSIYGQVYAKKSAVFGRLSVESVTCLHATSLVGLLHREDLKRTYFVGQD